MKRSELFRRVWETPMLKLATELGLSGPGLAKVCRRHDIPVPPRGYWAKLQAGKRVQAVPLPHPEQDAPISFRTADPAARAKEAALDAVLTAAARGPLPGGPVVVADTLETPHKLVRAVQRYVERLPHIVARFAAKGDRQWMVPESRRPPPETQGRYRFGAKGLLDITSSLAVMDWVLRWHDALFKALVAAGARIERREAMAGDWNARAAAAAVEIHYQGERAKIAFDQGATRVQVDREELARRRALVPQAAVTESRPSKRFSLRLKGTEAAARKVWAGTQEDLNAMIEEIVGDILELLPMQRALRAERETAEDAARRRAADAERERQRAQACAEQLKKAFELAEADRRSRDLADYLDRLEKECEEFRAPFPQRAKVWIAVMRHEVAERGPVQKLLGECLSGPYWSDRAPDWWPPGIEWPKLDAASEDRADGSAQGTDSER